VRETNRTHALGVVLCVALGFLAIGYLVLQIPSARAGLWTFPGTYQITARFGDIGDWRPGAPVTMAGVRVGRVTNITLNLRLAKAVVTMSIRDRYEDIPDDSSIAINSVSLLGGRYLSLDPGGSSTYLHNGSRIRTTRSAVEFETVIQDLMKSFAG
jgi:phospholipid/cholesterol/gamma-HCH transport system substrate-binding protein